MYRQKVKHIHSVNISKGNEDLTGHAVVGQYLASEKEEYTDLSFCVIVWTTCSAKLLHKKLFLLKINVHLQNL